MSLQKCKTRKRERHLETQPREREGERAKEEGNRDMGEGESFGVDHKYL